MSGEKDLGCYIGCMAQYGIELAVLPASALSFGNATQLKNSGVSLVRLAQNTTTDTQAKNGHLCRLSIQKTQPCQQAFRASVTLV